jgi:hypothetical protein
MVVAIRGSAPNLIERNEKWQFIELAKSFEWLLEKTNTDGG